MFSLYMLTVHFLCILLEDNNVLLRDSMLSVFKRTQRGWNEKLSHSTIVKHCTHRAFHYGSQHILLPETEQSEPQHALLPDLIIPIIVWQWNITLRYNEKLVINLYSQSFPCKFFFVLVDGPISLFLMSTIQILCNYILATCYYFLVIRLQLFW